MLLTKRRGKSTRFACYTITFFIEAGKEVDALPRGMQNFSVFGPDAAKNGNSFARRRRHAEVRRPRRSEKQIRSEA
jgi:hypothetical protein